MKYAYWLIVAALGAATPALGRTLQCNKAQTYCVTDDINVTVGDRVGLFNSEGELVATATVQGMSGEKRALRIEQRNGTISPDDRVALLENPAEGLRDVEYQAVRTAAPGQWGADLGFASVNSGPGLLGEDIGVFAEWRKWGNVYLSGRAVLFNETGTVRIYSNQQYSSQTLQVSGAGVLAGLGYESNPTRPFSLRVEAGIGAMDLNATLGGSASLDREQYDNTKVKGGVSLHARASFGGSYNIDTWHVRFGFAESLVDKAACETLLVGIAHDFGAASDKTEKAEHEPEHEHRTRSEPDPADAP